MEGKNSPSEVFFPLDGFHVLHHRLRGSVCGVSGIARVILDMRRTRLIIVGVLNSPFLFFPSADDGEMDRDAHACKGAAVRARHDTTRTCKRGAI